MPRLTASLTFLLATQLASGAGYQLAERSATGLGRAFSGEAAIADDASVIASNPAGMSLLDDQSFSFGITGIFADVDVQGSTPFAANISDQNIIAKGAVPYAFATKKLTDELTVGIGAFTTYGLKSDFSSEFASQTGPNFSELLSFNLNPSLSYQINDMLSIGAGFNALYADGELTSNSVGAVLPNTTTIGDDWGYGYNVGLLFTPNDSFRLGLHFRSAVSLELEGTFDAPALGQNNQDATLAVQLPEIVELSAYQELNDQWAVHADVLWTRWSKFDELDVVPSAGFNPPAEREDWENTLRYAIGATYQHNDRLTIRFGAAYDESPSRTEVRTLRIPDADRVWASAGFSYRFYEDISLDFGYTHIFADDADLRSNARGGNTGIFDGEATGRVNIVAIGLSGSF